MSEHKTQTNTTKTGDKASEAGANEALSPAPASGIVDPEVVPKATRRTFTAEYKLDILQRAALCERGQVGALLRQEGLYFAQLSAWRNAAAQGLEAVRRGPKPKSDDTNASELAELRRKCAALERQLKKAQIVIEIQKNHRASRLLLHLKLRSTYTQRARGGATVNFLVPRARKKTWSGGGCVLGIGDATKRSRLGN